VRALFLLLPASLALLPQARPLFYWGARTPLIDARDVEAPPEAARILTIQAALDAGDLVLRFDLDRPVRAATHLPDGTPVSGRLQARLYVDGDADAATGLAGEGSRDPRVGAERMILLSTLYMGEDEEEGRPARALVQVAIDSLDAGGRRRTLWARDHLGAPDRIALHGDWLEARLPALQAAVGAGSRFVYAVGSSVREGRLER
jgi:hypothetical protein